MEGEILYYIISQRVVIILGSAVCLFGEKNIVNEWEFQIVLKMHCHKPQWHRGSWHFRHT